MRKNNVRQCDQRQPRDGRHPNILGAARDYLRCGWKPVPIPRGNKGPTEAGWPKLRITRNNVADYFNGVRQNIGLKLGRASKGLADVDLHCPEAIALAELFLPRTGALFGQLSKPRSHWLYTTDLCETEQKAALKFNDLTGESLVELRIGPRGKAAQTMAPPSIDPNGERVRWDDNGKPRRVSGDDLKRSVSALAAGALLARHYPAKGSRHKAALVLGGVLHARNGRPMLSPASSRLLRASPGTRNRRIGSRRRKAR